MSEFHWLENEISILQEQLKALPTGKLVVTRSRSYFKWYINTQNHLSYLPKSQRVLAEKLAKRKYLSLRLKELTHEKTALQFYLRHHEKNSDKSQQLLLDESYQSLLAPQFRLLTDDLADWIHTPYQTNDKYPEQLIHQSSSGHNVRSKSESFIASLLYQNKIPFRYECALCLENTVFYPDFTILHPHTKKIYYWEHFGMMEIPSYAKNVYSKLQIYNSCNIIPFHNLILTFETKEQPLSITLVEKIIDYYFL